MTLDDFLMIARSRFDVDRPLYVRTSYGLMEITGVQAEADILPRESSAHEVRRCVLTVESAVIRATPDPMTIFGEMMDRIAPKKKSWEGGADDA